MTRRTLLALSGSAVAWASVRPHLPSAADRSEERSLLREPVQVPQDFLGMHAHRWPGAGTDKSLAPTYSFGAARSHDHDGTAWNEIHRAPDVFAWESLDRWVSVHSAARRTLIYTLYGTPSWLASKADPDLYGRSGGATAPRSLDPLSSFVKALVSRYNAEGERRVHFLETWNEPHFDGDAKGFWSGSAEELVAIGRTCALAAKGLNAGVRILSPGFVGDLAGKSEPGVPRFVAAKSSPAYQYLSASDGNGGNGATWCEAIAFHTYNTALQGANAAYAEDLLRFENMLRGMGIEKPLINTECGFVEPHPFRALPPRSQALCLKRLAAAHAAYGVQGLYFYSHDDDFVGNPEEHPEIAAALDDIHRQLAGATLLAVNVRQDGSIAVRTGKGAFTW